MTGRSHILAIDQGTTSTRAILFDEDGSAVATSAKDLTQSYPQPGWVEHDPEEIWQATCSVGRSVLEQAADASVAGIGITNQRETVVLWERESGQAVCPAIVWQDRRTEPICRRLRETGLESHVQQATGLVIDPYFSATKIAWWLESDAALAARAAAGELCCGTIDSWLVYRLTGGRRHVTDATNASRTMLFDIRSGAWDQTLMDRLGVPHAILPDVSDCQGEFGTAEDVHFGRALPILGMAGDQQAALVGQACFEPGYIKATYGTGCFVLVNTGPAAVASGHRMLTTIGYRLDGETTYALEGSIFMAGATMQWLRDGLGLFENVAETEAMAAAADPNAAIHLVPAFQGLGAPYWDADARGAILGLTRAATRNDIVRAGLEAIAFQTRDLLDAMREDMTAAGLAAPRTLRVDGGMTANGWLMQTIADTVDLPVEVAHIAETTALGAAVHAGLEAGVFQSMDSVAAGWRPSARYEPRIADSERAGRYDQWQTAVARVRS